MQSFNLSRLAFRKPHFRDEVEKRITRHARENLADLRARQRALVAYLADSRSRPLWPIGDGWHLLPPPHSIRPKAIRFAGAADPQ